MAGKNDRGRVFYTLPRKVLRKRLTSLEAWIGVACLLALAAVAFWVADRKDDFDPGERDVSFAVLQQDSVEDRLYRRPLKRWVEPGSTPSTGPAAVDLGIFPRGLLDDGWSVDGRVETYDPSNVYEKINGAAEQYLAFGFRMLHYVTLIRNDEYLTVELYDQAEFGNAFGLFAAQRGTDREVLRSGPVFYYETPVGAVGGLENYFFKISGDDETDAVTSKAAQLLQVMAGLPVDSGARSLPYTILTEGVGLAFDEVGYQKSNVFQFDFLTEVWFGNAGHDGDARFFVHEAAGAEEARALFDDLVREQEYDYTVRESGAERVILEHGYLGTFFAVVCRNRLVYGVDGAETEESAGELLGRLDRAVAETPGDKEGPSGGELEAGPTS